MTKSSRIRRRVLHTADLHLLSVSDRSSQSLEAIVELVNKSNVDLVIFAGDLFDHNRVEESLVRFTVEQLRRLAVTAVILPGNHDCLVQDSVYQRKDVANLWQSIPNVKIFKAQEGETLVLPELGISLWGKPICSYDGDVRPLEGIPPPEKNGLWHIAVAHGYYTGTAHQQQCWFSISLEEIATSCQDYVALGHWPSFRCLCSEPVKAYYCDSPSLSGTVNIVDLTEETGVEVSRCFL